jgi:hypothetical protein
MSFLYNLTANEEYICGCLSLTQIISPSVNTYRRLVRTITKVALRDAVVSIHANEDMHHEMEVGIVF